MNFKLIFISLFLFLLLGIFSLQESLTTVYARELRTTRVTRIEPPEGDERDYYIGAGESVEVDGVVYGDVYAVGGDIKVKGNVVGDLIAIGGTVIVEGNVSQDVRVIGGDVFLRGVVSGNTTVLSGLVEVSPPAKIEKGFVAVSGDVILNAPVEGFTNLYAGRVVISDQLGRDAEIYASDIDLTSNAKVVGDLIYTSESDAYVQEGASISGRLSRNTANDYAGELQQSVRGFRNRVNTGVWIMTFLTFLLTGIVFLKLTPGVFRSLKDTLNEKPLKSLFAGILVLFVVPIAVIILIVTILGIPLAVILLVFYMAAIFFSKPLLSLWIGDKFLKGKRKYLSFSLGLTLLMLLGSLPSVGGILDLIIVILSMGGIVLSIFKARKK